MKNLIVDETGLDEPKVHKTAVDEIAVDEPGPHPLGVGWLCLTIYLLHYDALLYKHPNYAQQTPKLSAPHSPYLDQSNKWTALSNTCVVKYSDTCVVKQSNSSWANHWGYESSCEVSPLPRHSLVSDMLSSTLQLSLSTRQRWLGPLHIFQAVKQWLLPSTYNVGMELYQQCYNKHTVQCTVDCTSVCSHAWCRGRQLDWAFQKFMMFTLSVPCWLE